MGKGGTIYIGDLEPDAGVRPAFDENDERAVTAAVKLGSAQEVRDVARQLTDKLRARGSPWPSATSFSWSFSHAFSSSPAVPGWSFPRCSVPDSPAPSRPRTSTPPSALEDWCVERCLRIQELIRQRRTDSAGELVQQAKRFINDHYAESDLSVERLCAHLHLSAAYFSTLFKREVGMSFTAYVTVVRMEAAATAPAHHRGKDLPHCPQVRL